MTGGGYPGDHSTKKVTKCAQCHNNTPPNANISTFPHATYGTTCACVGCMPSKLLIAAADHANAVATAKAVAQALPKAVAKAKAPVNAPDKAKAWADLCAAQAVLRERA